MSNILQEVRMSGDTVMLGYPQVLQAQHTWNDIREEQDEGLRHQQVLKLVTSTHHSMLTGK